MLLFYFILFFLRFCFFVESLVYLGDLELDSSPQNLNQHAPSCLPPSTSRRDLSPRKYSSRALSPFKNKDHSSRGRAKVNPSPSNQYPSNFRSTSQHRAKVHRSNSVHRNIVEETYTLETNTGLFSPASITASVMNKGTSTCSANKGTSTSSAKPRARVTPVVRTNIQPQTNFEQIGSGRGGKYVSRPVKAPLH